MTTSTSQEYGFPSTHSANAVSVAVYAFHLLGSAWSDSILNHIAGQVLLCIYAATIVLGRLYCGMHGLLDVGMGSLLGAALSLYQIAYGDVIDEYIYHAELTDIMAIVLCILAIVLAHPAPADPCPCSEDSVAFSGVLMGVEFGSWHRVRHGLGLFNTNARLHSPTLALENLSIKVIRIIVGLGIIFLWRAVMKAALSHVWPIIFRSLRSIPTAHTSAVYQDSMRADDVHRGGAIIDKELNLENSQSVCSKAVMDAKDTICERCSHQNECQHKVKSRRRKWQGNFHEAGCSSPQPLQSSNSPVKKDGRLQHRSEESRSLSDLTTKLVIYAGMLLIRACAGIYLAFGLKLIHLGFLGIAWLAVEGNPLLFDLLKLNY